MNLKNKFNIQGIDHVELFVPDRHAAAKWFREVLEFEIVPAYEDWADNKRGPLMISCDGGSTKLALFIGGRKGLEKQPVIIASHSESMLPDSFIF